jgi:hypothetical protein
MFVLNEWPLSGARLATGVSNCGGERSDRFLDFTLGNPTSDAHGKRISFFASAGVWFPPLFGRWTSLGSRCSLSPNAHLI